jgi:predicted RNA binding protein YcfA (HicA-like mRNA interferase family)
VKVPRDISGQDLIRRLKKLGYVPTRQSGSHIRLTTQLKGEHHITIPNHNPIKLGTLSAILSDIAGHFSKTKDEIIKEIF